MTAGKRARETRTFRVVEWRPVADGEGFEPNLPDGSSYLVLAETRSGSRPELALVEVDLGGDHRDQQLPRELVKLLRSAFRYPPAMAFARARAQRDSAINSRDAFIDRLAVYLRTGLEARASSPAFLAECIHAEAGFKGAGDSYWIVGYDPRRDVVRWISDDFYEYQDPVDHFAVEREELKRRFGAVPA